MHDIQTEITDFLEDLYPGVKVTVNEQLNYRIILPNGCSEADAKIVENYVKGMIDNEKRFRKEISEL